MQIGDICTREVVSVRADASILSAACLMREHHVGDVIVVSEKSGRRVPIGILTDRDIVVELVAKEVPLGDVTVGDAMSLDLLTARTRDDLDETVRSMRVKAVRRVPVVNDEGELVGVLSLDDLMGRAADYLSHVRALVSRERSKESSLRS